MLYELIAVVRPGNPQHIKEIATNTARTILSPPRGPPGVIRNIFNWGQFDLPRASTKYQAQHFQGHYFIIQFDGSVAAQTEIKRNLGLDPRMLRFSVVKMNDNHLGVKKKAGIKVPGIESVGGPGSLVWKEKDAQSRALGSLGMAGGAYADRVAKMK